MAQTISLDKGQRESRWWLALLPLIGGYVIILLLWVVQAGIVPQFFSTTLSGFWDAVARTSISKVWVELGFYAILIFVWELLVRNNAWVRYLRPLGFFTILLLAWDGLARSGIWASFLFVGPVDVKQALSDGFQSFAVDIVFTLKGIFVLILLVLLGISILIRGRVPRKLTTTLILTFLSLLFLTIAVSTGNIISDIVSSFVSLVPVLGVSILVRELVPRKFAGMLTIGAVGLFFLSLVVYSLFFLPAPIWNGPQNFLSIISGLISLVYNYVLGSIAFVYVHHLILIVLALLAMVTLTEGVVSKRVATIYILFFFGLFFLSSTILAYEPSVFSTAILTSAVRLDIGYFTSVVIGVSLGLLIGLNQAAKQTVGSLVLGFQALPSVCWIPLALLWFGLSENAMYFVVIMGALFSIVLGVEAGVRNTPPVYLKAARNMGASGLNLAFRVVLPAALPSIIVGLRQGWTFAWRSLMAAELLYVTVSLGGLLEESRTNLQIPELFAVMAIIIIVGVLIDSLIFSPLERTVRVRWGYEKEGQ